MSYSSNRSGEEKTHKSVNLMLEGEEGFVEDRQIHVTYDAAGSLQIGISVATRSLSSNKSPSFRSTSRSPSRSKSRSTAFKSQPSIIQQDPDLEPQEADPDDPDSAGKSLVSTLSQSEFAVKRNSRGSIDLGMKDDAQGSIVLHWKGNEENPTVSELTFEEVFESHAGSAKSVPMSVANSSTYKPQSVVGSLAESASKPQSVGSLAESGSKPLSAGSLAESGSKPLSVGSLAESASKPLSAGSLAESASKPQSVGSLADSASKPLSAGSLAEGASKPLSVGSMADSANKPLSVGSLAGSGSKPLSGGSQAGSAGKPQSAASLATASTPFGSAGEKQPSTLGSGSKPPSQPEGEELGMGDENNDQFSDNKDEEGAETGTKHSLGGLLQQRSSLQHSKSADHFDPNAGKRKDSTLSSRHSTGHLGSGRIMPSSSISGEQPRELSLIQSASSRPSKGVTAESYSTGASANDPGTKTGKSGLSSQLKLSDGQSASDGGLEHPGGQDVVQGATDGTDGNMEDPFSTGASTKLSHHTQSQKCSLPSRHSSELKMENGSVSSFGSKSRKSDPMYEGTGAMSGPGGPGSSTKGLPTLDQQGSTHPSLSNSNPSMPTGGPSTGGSGRFSGNASGSIYDCIKSEQLEAVCECPDDVIDEEQSRTLRVTESNIHQITQLMENSSKRKPVRVKCGAPYCNCSYHYLKNGKLFCRRYSRKTNSLSCAVQIGATCK